MEATRERKKQFIGRRKKKKLKRQGKNLDITGLSSSSGKAQIEKYSDERLKMTVEVARGKKMKTIDRERKKEL